MAALLMAVVAAGCDPESGADGEREEGDVVRVAAEVARQINTRAYQEQGEVTEGTYYLTYPLTYPTSNDSKQLAEVHFGVEGSSPDIGMVIVPPDSKELKWIDVGEGATPTFFLDNVERGYAVVEKSTLTEIVFNERNPFVAGLFDLTENAAARPANDLLWGSKQASRGAKMVSFDLHHYMARVRVQVTVDRTNEQENGDLDLEDATVTISSLVHKPYSYNRLDGTMALSAPDKNPAYETLTLVGTDDGKTYDWNKMVDEDENGLNDVYTTCDFVLPPQGLLEDEGRPVLTIQLADKADGTKGKVYSGILPHAMEIDDGYPVALSFLKEYILTIRTVVTETPPELSFMPVQVVQWVDKGDFTIEAHQSGVYTVAEFDNLVKYYNENNTYQLVRYGKFNEEKKKWVFDFWHSVTLDYDKIKGSMKGNNFEFRFNNFKIWLSDRTDPITEKELYDIVNE